jgi:hypothetical protein
LRDKAASVNRRLRVRRLSAARMSCRIASIVRSAATLPAVCVSGATSWKPKPSSRQQIANMPDRTGLEIVQRLENGADERPKVHQAVRFGSNDNGSEWQFGELMLMFDVPIHGDHRIDLPSRASQQFAVGHAGPAQPLNCLDLVTHQLSN